MEDEFEGMALGGEMAKNDGLEFPDIPDHDLIECVGKGAYGRIYLAVNVIGGNRAIKVIHRNAFENQRPYDREFMGIVKYEPLSRGHANLVSVLHIGRDRSNQFFYYVMEIADDVTHGTDIPQSGYTPRTLQSDLRRYGWLAVEDCVRIACQVLDGLSCLHERRLIHRDIKPPNIIFVGGNAKLADVGLVSTIGEASTYVGSETYVPPEGPGSPLGDLFAVGKMLYEMVTGLSSFQFPEVNDDFVSFPDLSVRKRLCQIAAKACENDSKKRFVNAEAFRVELEKAIAERDIRADADSVASVNAITIPIKRIVVVGDFSASEFSDTLARLYKEFDAREISVFRDDATAVTVSWARTIEAQISESDAVIAFLSDRVLSSETLAYELHLANSEAEVNEGKPRVIPLVNHLSVELPEEISQYFRARRIVKMGELDLNSNLFSQVFGARAPDVSPPTAGAAKAKLETVGGAVPLGSPFYVARGEDEYFSQAIENRESIVLVKGARQMGKTSLLARGLQVARKASYTVLFTDYQKLNRSAFESLEKFYLALANSISEQLDLDRFPEDTWDSRRSPNANLERYLRKGVFEEFDGHIVWGMDEIDRLFGCDFSGEVFGMFRSWHNNRALDPDSCWGRHTLALAYATEARLLITDMMQSPFNVGTRLSLGDFSTDQVRDLNVLYGAGLSPDELEALYYLVGGHPFLTRVAMHAVVAEGRSMDEIISSATSDESVFADHLRRLVLLLAADETLVNGVKEILVEKRCSCGATYQRLRASGMVQSADPDSVLLRCDLYSRYLKRELEVD